MPETHLQLYLSKYHIPNKYIITCALYLLKQQELFIGIKAMQTKKRNVMKKIFVKSALLCAMMMMGMQANAQVSLGNILKGVASAASGSTSSTEDGGLLSGLTSIFSKDKVATKDQIVGTWTYQEPAVVMTSDNVLENLGGKVAANALEKRLKTNLEKYGFKSGAITMTFDADGNFTQKFKKRTLKGTYTIEDKNVVLKYGGQVSQIVGTTQIDGNDLLIVMDATKLLKYVKILGSLSQNTALKGATTILGNMKGMECGLKLTKK